MNQPIIPDMQVLARMAVEADRTSPSIFKIFLGKLFGSPNPVEKGTGILLSRANDYETTQPNFADELRIAAAGRRVGFQSA